MKFILNPSEIYLLFAELANQDVDTDQRLDRFLKKNIEPAKGISKKYILDILEQAFLDGETLNVKLVRKEVLIRNCLDWIKRNREENTVDAEITAFKPESNTGAFILTYERLFKNPSDCTRITKIILDEGCVNGIFKGFEGVLVTPMRQLLITYDIIKENFLKPSLAETHGTKDTCKQLFYERFGWEGYRDSERPKGKNAVNLKKSKVAYQIKNNLNAKRDIELTLV